MKQTVSFRRLREPFSDKGHEELLGLAVATEQQCSLLARENKKIIEASLGTYNITCIYYTQIYIF